MLISPLYGSAPSRRKKRRLGRRRNKRFVKGCRIEDIRDPSLDEHDVRPIYFRDDYRH